MSGFHAPASIGLSWFVYEKTLTGAPHDEPHNHRTKRRASASSKSRSAPFASADWRLFHFAVIAAVAE
jgi:hypothetical protein